MKNFGKEEELWLLNRLDNETAGFLYFAKTQEAYATYRNLQSEWKVNKRYIAQIHGTPKESAFEITIPVMHHKHKEDRMIVIHSYKDKHKWRSKVHKPSTIVKVLHTDKNNVSTLLVGIYKWVRHQIRVHLAGVGYPVIGDTLYGKDKHKWNLRLRSVGFQIQ
jgi:23S rRNA pseudouridine1911/1915/1917 synthase